MRGSAYWRGESMKTGPLWLLGLVSGIAVTYIAQASQFRKYWRVEINGYRISPWVCSAVFMFWILGMAVSIYMLSFIPTVLHKLGL